MVLDKYSHLKEELLKCIDSMSFIEGIPGCPCEELKDKIQENAFNLVVLGQFKRGKTTLINSLLGAEILPTAVVPLTSIVTKEEPVVLEVLTTSFTLSLPKFVGDKIILKKMKEYMLEMIDTQGGRVRYNFVERLDKGKLDFRWEMFERIQATIEGISKAIDNGMSQKSKGEQAVEKRKTVLLETEKGLSEIKNKLIQIRQQVSS